MKDINYISEKYRKYLLEVIFEEQKYYTVFGADFSDNEIDKLLVGIDKNILLFSTPEDLLAVIQKSTCHFDNKVLGEWAKESFGIKSPYAIINFDVLSLSSIDLKDSQLFKTIYDTLGIVEDYSNQVSNEGLLNLLGKDVLSQFKDELSDYFIWSESKEFKISVDVDMLLFYLNNIYKKVKEKITIHQ
ncbi:hypothetical protein CLV51_104450 [Chitinophaga niastensis]|uniref:Uncharacterized protein n=1 Tax=Chitinophaga niastensis TaxID=536980 RepID=A0A2P8HHQ0_CHINA|nr:hypothetical protein [Chitinophaga niastensis]PSL45743.1 hypothetical protein CLV51_104450 [Chitinophaga niastensis]